MGNGLLLFNVYLGIIYSVWTKIAVQVFKQLHCRQVFPLDPIPVNW